MKKGVLVLVLVFVFLFSLGVVSGACNVVQDGGDACTVTHDDGYVCVLSIKGNNCFDYHCEGAGTSSGSGCVDDTNTGYGEHVGLVDGGAGRWKLTSTRAVDGSDSVCSCEARVVCNADASSCPEVDVCDTNVGIRKADGTGCPGTCNAGEDAYYSPIDQVIFKNYIDTFEEYINYESGHTLEPMMGEPFCYGDYTSENAVVRKGEKTLLTLDHPFPMYNSVYGRVWIDWNGDGVFNDIFPDTGEIYKEWLFRQSIYDDLESVVIDIPDTAAENKALVMRVASNSRDNFGMSENPECGGKYQNMEDYSICIGTTCYKDADGDGYRDIESVFDVSCPIDYYVESYFANMNDVDCDDTDAGMALGCIKSNIYDEPGDYEFKVPEGVSELTVAVYGAGGGGYSYYSTSAVFASGGGGGGYATAQIGVVPEDIYDIVVGNGAEGVLKGGGDYEPDDAPMAEQSSFSLDGLDFIIAYGGRSGTHVSGLRGDGGEGGSGMIISDSKIIGSGTILDGDSVVRLKFPPVGVISNGGNNNGPDGSLGSTDPTSQPESGGGGGAGMGRPTAASAGGDGKVIISWIIPPGECSPDQMIMKLSKLSSAYGALHDNADYDVDICYSDIFWEDWDGAVSHPTSCASPVVWLSDSENALASVERVVGSYETPVCFGDLGCKSTDGECSSLGAGFKCVVKLSDETDAYLSVCSDNSYSKKICCESGLDVGGPYWADMNGEGIAEAEKNDLVKMVVPGGGLEGWEIDYEIFESKDLLGIDWLWRDKKVAQGLSEGFATWRAGEKEDGSFDDGNYYFEISVDGGSTWTDSRDGVNGGRLEVLEVEVNKPPVASISGLEEGGIYFVNVPLHFNQVSSDEDDGFGWKWEFKSEDGSFREGNSDNMENKEFKYTYTTAGQKDIVLTVTDDRGEDVSSSVSILVIGSPDAFVWIGSPGWYENVDGYFVDFDVSGSYVVDSVDVNTVRCLGGACPEMTVGCPVGGTCVLGVGLPVSNRPTGDPDFSGWTFDWKFDESSSNNAELTTAEVEFDFPFGSIGEHEAKVDATFSSPSDGDILTSSRVMFFNYIANTCTAAREIWWDSEGFPHNTLTEPGACKESIFHGNLNHCCPLGMQCLGEDQVETCQSVPEECTGMVSCGNYGNLDDCEADSCSAGAADTGYGTLRCGDRIDLGTISECDGLGFDTNVISTEGGCGCTWDTNRGCIQSEELLLMNNGEQVSGFCEKSIETRECNEGFLDVDIINSMAWDELTFPAGLTSTPELESCGDELCPDDSYTTLCGGPVVKLPGFGFVNIILVLFCLGIFYFVLRRR